MNDMHYITTDMLLQEAVRKAKEFKRSTEFTRGTYHDSAKPFLASRKGMDEIAKAFEEALSRLPKKIQSRADAVYSRRLAVSALLSTRAFRRGTIQRLRMSHLHIVNGVVHLDAPPEIMKNNKPIKGPLPDFKWLHETIRRYTEEGRPILVGPGTDEGYWFTASCGGKLTAINNVCRHDKGRR